MHGASLWSFKRTTNIRNLSFKLFFDTRVSMASMAEKDRSRYRIADRCPYATNGRQKHQRWNSSYFTSLRKSQQKYMKDYDPNKESSYYMYWDFNNLYGWKMSQKLLVDGFEWRKDLFRFDEEFIQYYEEDNDKWYKLKVDIKHPKELQDLRSYLPLLPIRMKNDKSWKTRVLSVC